jgi:hypothetical protein
MLLTCYIKTINDQALMRVLQALQGKMDYYFKQKEVRWIWFDVFERERQLESWTKNGAIYVNR